MYLLVSNLAGSFVITLQLHWSVASQPLPRLPSLVDNRRQSLHTNVRFHYSFSYLVSPLLLVSFLVITDQVEEWTYMVRILCIRIRTYGREGWEGIAEDGSEYRM